MSSGFGRQDDAAKRPTESSPRSPDIRQSNDHLLERVLSQAGSDAAPTGFFAPGQLEAARAAARKYRGQPFTLDPALIEFIHAALAVQFAGMGISAATIQAMARTAAQTLYEDEPSRQRLEALWLRLAEEQP